MKTMEIIEIRTRLKMTQTAFAHALGVQQVTVCRWETGKQKPSKLARKQLERLEFRVVNLFNE